MPDRNSTRKPRPPRRLITAFFSSSPVIGPSLTVGYRLIHLCILCWALSETFLIISYRFSRMGTLLNVKLQAIIQEFHGLYGFGSGPCFQTAQKWQFSGGNTVDGVWQWGKWPVFHCKQCKLLQWWSRCCPPSSMNCIHIIVKNLVELLSSPVNIIPFQPCVYSMRIWRQPARFSPRLPSSYHRDTRRKWCVKSHFSNRIDVRPFKE